jgi:hypothetical protein
MSGPPGHPPFEPIYEPSFAEARARLGLSGASFDSRFADVERHLADYPRSSATKAPEHEGIWMLRTKEAFPDIPPLIVYYRVTEQPNRIVYLSLSPDWSKPDVI